MSVFTERTEKDLKGARITLREARADDREELRREYLRLSDGSRHMRFHGGAPPLTDELLDYLLAVDGKDHVAIVATTDSLDLKTDRGIGIARFIRLKDEPDVAEAAVTVVDDMQGRGVGRMLVVALAEAARACEIRAFRAAVLASNTPMRKMLEEAGATVRDDDGETIVFDVAIDPPPGEAPHDEPEGRIRRFLRIFAMALVEIRKALAQSREPPAP